MKQIIILIALCLGVNVFSMSTQEALNCTIVTWNEIERAKANELTEKNYRDTKKCGSERILEEKK